jgi:hypothetical protein
VLRNLPCQKIQADEQWGFVGCKQRNRATAKNLRRGMGDTIIKAEDIRSRTLSIAIPKGSITSAQQVAIEAAKMRAERLGVIWIVTPF